MLIVSQAKRTVDFNQPRVIPHSSRIRLWIPSTYIQLICQNAKKECAILPGKRSSWKWPKAKFAIRYL